MVGYRSDRAAGWFARCAVVAVVGNDAGIDNDGAETPVELCSEPVGAWTQLWPRLRRPG